MIANTTYQLKWAWMHTSGHRGRLFGYFMLELVALLLSLLFVYWSKQAVDIAMHDTAANLKQVLFLVAASLTLGLLMRALSAWLMERTRLQMGLELQREIIDLQMLSPWKLAKHWHSGDLQVRINSDCKEVTDMLAFSAMSFVLTVMQLLAAFGFLWMFDSLLALMIVAVTPLFLFSKLYYKTMRRLSREVKQQESQLGQVLQENLRFRLLIRAMDLLPKRQRKLEQRHQEIFRLKSAQLNFATLTQTAMKLTIHAGYLLTFSWGLYRLHAGAISFGTMTAFLQLVGRIQSPIMTMSSFVPMYIRFRTALERLVELAKERPEVLAIPQHITGIEALYVEQLQFRYEDDVLIEGLDMVLRRAEPLAIVGNSGRGKTTLMRIMLGMLEPQGGRLWFDAQGVAHPLTAATRINFAYVPQGNTLFSGSISENLMIAAADAGEAQIRHALWIACAEFVYELPQGLDTLVGEGGHGLSEGQAQRIAIARAMMRPASVWLFDEVTAALDQETSKLLRSRLLAGSSDKLCVFVTHDLSLAAACSQTIYL